MSRNVIVAIVIVVIIAIGGAAWYYSSRIRPAEIEKILSNPRAYEGKVVTIEGEVTDRTAFFIAVKFFRVKDKTGEMTVVTKRILPEIGSTVRVKGKIDEVFAIGDQKFIVLVEESTDEKARKK